MLYKLDNKLYVQTNSYYVEVILEDNGDDIVLSPTDNKTAKRLFADKVFEETTFEEEKRKFKSKKEVKEDTSKETKKNYSKFIK